MKFSYSTLFQLASCTSTGPRYLLFTALCFSWIVLSDYFCFLLSKVDVLTILLRAKRTRNWLKTTDRPKKLKQSPKQPSSEQSQSEAVIQIVNTTTTINFVNNFSLDTWSQPSSSDRNWLNTNETKTGSKIAKLPPKVQQ